MDRSPTPTPAHSSITENIKLSEIYTMNKDIEGVMHKGTKSLCFYACLYSKLLFIMSKYF